MGCDGNTVVSVCLNGVLKVWNSNAENIASVDRKRYIAVKEYGIVIYSRLHKF